LLQQYLNNGQFVRYFYLKHKPDCPSISLFHISANRAGILQVLWFGATDAAFIDELLNSSILPTVENPQRQPRAHNG
jgi:hypothetical protein